MYQSLNGEEARLYAVAPGYQSRLNGYYARISKEEFNVNFDKDVLQVCLRYAWSPSVIQEVRTYLNRLIIDGHPFSRSYVSYQSMMETVAPFAREHRASFTWNCNYQRAKERVLKRYAKAHLNPYHINSEKDLQNLTENNKASTGWYGILTNCRSKGQFCSKSSVKVLEKVTERALSRGTFGDVTIFGTRSQASGEYTEEGVQTHHFKWKTRAVWVTDACRVYSELRFAKPLSNWLKAYSHSGIGKSDEDIKSYVLAQRLQASAWVSLDYSKYDASIPGWLISDAFEVIRTCFPSLTVRDSQLLDILEHDFIHKRCLLKDGLVLNVHHGVPSGSGFTSIVDGIVNELITETWTEVFGIKTYGYMILGDDNLIFYAKQDLDVRNIASYISHNFGIEVNTDKTDMGTDAPPKFLSRLWTVNGPYRHPAILTSHLLFPERFRVYDSVVTPELVFYSYIIGYGAGMKEWFDVERFMRENHFAVRISDLTDGELRELPWNVQLRARLTRKKAA